MMQFLAGLLFGLILLLLSARFLPGFWVGLAIGMLRSRKPELTLSHCPFCERVFRE